MSSTTAASPLEEIPCHHTEYLQSAHEVLDTEARAIQAMSDSLGEAFCQLIDRILNLSGRLIIMGMGKSGHIGRKIAATLASTGQPSLFVHPAEASHGDLGMITQNDMVIAFSNTGETTELSNIIEYTRRFSIPLVGITRRGESTLSRLADLSLTIPDYPEACPMGLAPTTSTTMMLALGDAIAIALLKSRGFSPTDFKIYHPGGSLGARLHRVKDRMHTGEKIPLVAKNTPMKEAILIMSEKSFGCVGVLDENQSLVGIITDGDLRRHMSEDLLKLTAQQVMTQNPITIGQDMLMTEALALMHHKKKTSLFIVESNKNNIISPIGFIHVHDFLRIGIV